MKVFDQNIDTGHDFAHVEAFDNGIIDLTVSDYETAMVKLDMSKAMELHAALEEAMYLLWGMPRSLVK